MAVLVGLVCATPAVAQQDRPAHWLHAGAMPPGAIGRQRLMLGGPLSPYNPRVGYWQPTALRVPEGARIAALTGEAYTPSAGNQLLVGLQLATVYRFKVTDLPNYPGVEIFPTVELLDRLHPPPGKAMKFPVPIELTFNELLLAADGKFVTRVIYVEDPQLASAIARDADEEQTWFEVDSSDDPLVAAQAFGRPIAILRMGSRVPEGPPGDAALPYAGAQPRVYSTAPEMQPNGETPYPQ